MQNENVTQMTKHLVFERLIDKELPRLRAVAFRFLGNAHDADEVIQNALLKAWQKFADFKNESKLSSWVCRIVINECHEIVRKQKVESKYLKAYAENKVCEDSGETGSLSCRQFARLRLALAELPEIYRLALCVGFLSDLPSEDAARQLGCSPNTLYQRIHKAKSLLKKQLAKLQTERI